ncbi:MAG: dTDP-4-dehydrorhamnose reductase [Chloroflexi bacterium]|nr:dTDP-4-dehydrorhamnose reductase [Chloroflexota bacterium]
MKILITGANGQLGRSLLRTLTAHDLVPLARANLDITDADACARALDEHRPQAVIHCAALTDTNRCEQDPALARAVNGIGTEHVARACARTGARLVAISTNEVFDGAQSTPYVENARPNPLNAYALSKLDGEVLAAARHADTLIVRASWLYGDGYVNFNEKVLAAAAEGRPLRFVTDEIATPTATDDLARAIATLLEHGAPPGIYHLSNGGEASRHDWAVEILHLAGRSDTPVESITTADLRATGYTGPQKPPYSVLANTRAAALGITLRDWRDALKEYFDYRETGNGAQAPPPV